MREKSGILVSRAGTQTPSDALGGHRKPKSKPSRMGKNGPAKKAQREDVVASKKTPTFILHSLLKPSKTQKATLDAIFSGPVLLRNLLQESGVKHWTPNEAGLFLLQNYKALQPYLYANDRHAAIEFLKKLVLDWGRTHPELTALELPHGCSISANNEVFLPIPGLGPLAVADVGEMQAERKGRRYKSSFVLIHSKWGYVAEIELFGNSEHDALTSVPEAPSLSKKVRRKAVKSPPEKKSPENIPFAQFMEIFSNTLNARLMDELRIYSRYAKSDFDALEGRPVQGGLPSLGKGR